MKDQMEDLIRDRNVKEKEFQNLKARFAQDVRAATATDEASVLNKKLIAKLQAEIEELQVAIDSEKETTAKLRNQLKNTNTANNFSDASVATELNSIKQTFTTLQTLFDSTASMIKDANAKIQIFTGKQ